MTRKAIACAISGFDMSFFSEKKAKLIHSGFVVLLGKADASALLMEVHSQLDAPSTFFLESFLELSHFVQSMFSSEEGLRAEEKQTVGTLS